jgi:hypothetical protein
MNHPLTTDHYALTTSEERHLAAELTGCPPGDLLKVRATADSLVVVIHTGQKFIYDLAAIQAALERLAEGAGRFARETFLAELNQDAQAILAARDAEAATPGQGRTGKRRMKLPRIGSAEGRAE